MATVIIRRTATLENSCEGRYRTITTGLNDQTREFTPRTGNAQVYGTQVLRDIYCTNDGVRIKCETDTLTLLMDDKPGA